MIEVLVVIWTVILGLVVLRSMRRRRHSEQAEARRRADELWQQLLAEPDPLDPELARRVAYVAEERRKRRVARALEKLDA